MGNQLLALRLYQAPTMYNPMSPKPILHFDQENYKNSCSFKSCCFAGDRDQVSYKFVNQTFKSFKRLFSTFQVRLLGF